MRRKDREVTDIAKIEEIMKRCKCCRIGFSDNGEIYIVPLNFGYEVSDNKFVLFFHGAKAGRKFELAKTSPDVGFEMDTGYTLEESDTACTHSALYQSIIGNGTISIVSDSAKKRHGLSLIMENATGRRMWDFDDKAVNAVAVFKLEISKISCKEHK